jgi:outer membrane lipoprotein SlyB
MNALAKGALARRLPLLAQPWPERASANRKREPHGETSQYKTCWNARTSAAQQVVVMNAENGTMAGPRRLNPLVAGAAAAVMVFSLLGIAAITGLLPRALSQKSADVAPGAVSEAKPVTCPSCGTVESIRPVEVRGDATGLGVVAGGLTGAVVGHQMGNGRGNTAMTVIGAAGGAFAGNEIEKNMKKHVVYRVTVRMDDGSFRTLSQASVPAFAPGDKVRVVQGALHASKS